MSHFVLLHWIMIQTFIAHTTSKTVVRGVIGQPVQLPCFYQVTRHTDISDMCWGRGPCPNSKCNNKILHTTGNRVTFRKSQRYNLQGYISYGDVSLTIGKVKAEDAGTYCCRIEILGWFNDIKKNIQLEVVRAPPVKTTTTRKAPVSPRHFRKTTFAPQATSDHQTTAKTAVVTTTIPKVTTATTDHQTTAEAAVLLTTTVPKVTTATTDHQTTAEAAVLLTTTVPKVTTATTDHQTTAEAAVPLTTTVPKVTTATTDHQTTAEAAVLLTTTVPKVTTATTDHQTTAEAAVPLTTTVPKVTTATTDHQTTAEAAVLLTTTVPKVTTATTDHQTTAEAAVLLTTTVPKVTTATTDHQTTAEAAVLLTTTVPIVTTATIASPAVISLEITAPPTFAVTANDVFPETMGTTSGLPDFSTSFQADDMMTEDDDMFCPRESLPLPGSTNETTEFSSIRPTAEGTESADTSFMVEDLSATGISESPDDKAASHDDNRDKLPIYAFLIACLIVVPTLFVLIPSLLFWKRKHTQKFIIKSLGPVEDLEKVFSGSEGENNIFPL